MPVSEWLLVVVGAGCLGVAEGGGGKSIFELGTDIDHDPINVLLMYLSAILISIVLEFTVDTVHERVTSESGTTLVHHITQELMILGGISAILVVVQNLGGGANIDTTLFHYVHFVIFAMAMFFITLVGSLFLTVERSWEIYSNFERRAMEVMNDPSMSLQAKRIMLSSFIYSTKNGKQMWCAIQFFRQNLPPHFKHISFTRYMKKQQRKFLLTFLDLKGSTWFFLSLLTGTQALITMVTQKRTDNDLAIISLWVLFVGFGPVAMLIVTFFKIKKEFRLFTHAVESMRVEGHLRPPWPQKLHFWMGTPSFTVSFIQVLLLYQVFYLATVTVNFVYRLWLMKMGLLLIACCYVPSCVVFFLMIPLVMPPFTILASLNDLLDMDTIVSIALSDKAKERRGRERDAVVLCPSRFFLDDWWGERERDILLAAQVSHASGLFEDKSKLRAGGGALLQIEELMKAKADLEDGDVEMQPFEAAYDRSKLCHECQSKWGAVVCRICGTLCAECDIDYHRLRLCKEHEREQLDQGEVMAAARKKAPKATKGKKEGKKAKGVGKAKRREPSSTSAALPDI
eukprot:Sspe_Gene.71690::Locus_42588_Transcript_1_1_Confidence_1.000_Length_1931::g.71690::m.71690